MEEVERKEMEEASLAIVSMIQGVEKTKDKFAQGTSQHTLQKNRLNALKILLSIISRELMTDYSNADYCEEELKNAVAPIASLISKSEKAQMKLKPGSWQHTMLSKNLKALYIASPLLFRAIDAAK